MPAASQTARRGHGPTVKPGHRRGGGRHSSSPAAPRAACFMAHGLADRPSQGLDVAAGGAGCIDERKCATDEIGKQAITGLPSREIKPLCGVDQPVGPFSAFTFQPGCSCEF
ncbi:hypothetical protein [Streptomyces sp. f150]|uniref:hypothetical protein n=1 Tax=Streptomyces sp. f150 TaxID=1827699 RepID=UPI00117E8A6F|nr:hypothetical protein [Streptomyces sp. f150]